MFDAANVEDVKWKMNGSMQKLLMKKFVFSK